MHPFNLYTLIHPNTLTFLDIQGVNWETWLAQIEEQVNYRVASEWAIARSLVNDRVREWRLYDDKLYALRVIKAFILWTAPIHWFTYQGVIGGGPFASVRNLLAFLWERVRAIRSQVASQQREQMMFPGGGGNAAVIPQGYVYPAISERIWG